MRMEESTRHFGVKTGCLFCIFQVQRIPEYDKYLNELLQETDQSHPDFEDLKRAADKVRNVSMMSYTGKTETFGYPKKCCNYPKT